MWIDPDVSFVQYILSVKSNDYVLPWFIWTPKIYSTSSNLDFTDISAYTTDLKFLEVNQLFSALRRSAD